MLELESKTAELESKTAELRIYRGAYAKEKAAREFKTADLKKEKSEHKKYKKKFKKEKEALEKEKEASAAASSDKDIRILALEAEVVPLISGSSWVSQAMPARISPACASPRKKVLETR